MEESAATHRSIKPYRHLKGFFVYKKIPGSHEDSDTSAKYVKYEIWKNSRAKGESNLIFNLDYAGQNELGGAFVLICSHEWSSQWPSGYISLNAVYTCTHTCISIAYVIAAVGWIHVRGNTCLFSEHARLNNPHLFAEREEAEGRANRTGGHIYAVGVSFDQCRRLIGPACKTQWHLIVRT